MSNIGTTEFYLRIAQGEIEGHTRVSVRGFNPDIDTGATENLWDLGGNFVYPAAGEQWEVLSGDANDTSAGTGARTVVITYLDDNYIKQSETVTMNGTSAVSTVATDMFRPISAVVLTVGSGNENAGLITVQVASAGDGRLGIIAGENTSVHGFYTTPAEKTAFLISAYSTAAKNKDVTLELQSTVGTAGIFYGIVPVQIYQNTAAIKVEVPLPLVEKSDLRIKCTTENNNTEGNVILSIIEIDN